MTKKNFIKYFVAVIIIAVLGFGGYRIYLAFFSNMTSEAPIATSEVKRGKFVLKINDLGFVSARKYTPVFAPIAGKIIKLCKEGTTVKKGDFLAQLDTTSLDKELKEKELLYEQALADVTQAEEELRILKITAELNIKTKISQQQYDKTELEVAKNKLERQKRLYKEQIVTLKEVEAEESSVRSKEVAVRRDAIDVDIERQKMRSDIIKKQAEIELKKTKAEGAELDYKLAAANKNKATIRAEGNGLVVFRAMWRGDAYVKLAEGDDVYNRANIMSISDVSSLIVNVRLRETDIHRAALGQKVNIFLEALPGEVFYGKVETVSNIADSSGDSEISTGPGQKMFPVSIGVIGDPGVKMRPGMTASVEIIEKEIPDALYLPIDAVFSSEDGKYVWKKEGDSFRKVFIEIIDRNEDYAAINGDLKKGDVVALSDVC